MNSDHPPNPDRPLGTLDEDIVQALNAQQAASEADPAMLARVRSRVLKRIAAETTPQHTTVPVEDANWSPFLPGIDRKVLFASGNTMSYLLRFAPGAVLPAHHHPEDEECIVVDGILRIGNDLELKPGGFHMAHAGAMHESSTSDTGCVIYLRGPRPRVEHII
jgi:anti-sigma factor ChrR (cupin superfamily)